MGENAKLVGSSSDLDRRRFIKLLAGSAAAAGLPLSLTSCSGAAAAAGRKVIVLGLDGLDPHLVQVMIDSGRAPNFKKLAELGSFKRLGTTMPALSPVAWSSFITGMSPGSHGIADFVMRDPKTYVPVFSIYENQEPDVVLDFGDYHMPLKGGGPVNLRKGKPFWSYLTERGIPAMVSKIPTNYPVDTSATYALSGMGTPDLAGEYGQFTYYTMHASGHDPRPDKKHRQRNRVFHKFSYMPTNLDVLGCVGCGRCISRCPVNIDIVEVVEGVKALGAEKPNQEAN